MWRHPVSSPSGRLAPQFCDIFTHWALAAHVFRALSICLCMCLVTQSCPTLCDPMDYTVQGILQARILEWIAFPFSRGSSQPRDRFQVSRTAGRFFTSFHPSVPH